MTCVRCEYLNSKKDKTNLKDSINLRFRLSSACWFKSKDSFCENCLAEAFGNENP